MSTLGHGQGEGPARYKLFAQQMTQEMVGGAGVERVSAERSPPGGYTRSSYTLSPQYNISDYTKEEGDRKSN